MALARNSASPQQPPFRRCHYSLAGELPLDVKLQTPHHALRPHDAPPPAPQNYHQTHIGESQKQQDYDIRDVHALI
jgi:hypothetical protein